MVLLLTTGRRHAAALRSALRRRAFSTAGAQAADSIGGGPTYPMLMREFIRQSLYHPVSAAAVAGLRPARTLSGSRASA